jgi:hypothetical protein
MNNKTNNFNLKGGDIYVPSWFNLFLSELAKIYSEEYVITGSSAVALYVNYFNNLTNGDFNELFKSMLIPNDVDFLYSCIGTNYISFKNYINRFERHQSSPNKSLTFKEKEKTNNLIKSVDFTCLENIQYFTIDGYKILSIYELKEFYSKELKDYEKMLDNSISYLEFIDKTNKKEYQELIENICIYKDKIPKLKQKKYIVKTLLTYIKSNIENEKIYKDGLKNMISRNEKPELPSLKNPISGRNLKLPLSFLEDNDDENNGSETKKTKMSDETPPYTPPHTPPHTPTRQLSFETPTKQLSFETPTKDYKNKYIKTKLPLPILFNKN